MRPFKFKVWDSKNHCWVEDELYDLGEEFNLISCDMEGCALLADGSLVLMDECGRYAPLDTSRFIFVEWTTRQDKMGHDIYDGDIVEVNHPDADEPFCGLVFWNEWDRSWCHTFLEGRPSKGMWQWAKVLGSAFDKPELLDKLPG